MNEDTYIIHTQLPSGDYLDCRLYDEADAVAVARVLAAGGLETKLFLLGAAEVEF